MRYWDEPRCLSITNGGSFLESAVMLATAPEIQVSYSLDLHCCSILVWQKACLLTFLVVLRLKCKVLQIVPLETQPPVAESPEQFIEIYSFLSSMHQK